jgi:hypothetical protein
VLGIDADVVFEDDTDCADGKVARKTRLVDARSNLLRRPGT